MTCTKPAWSERPSRKRFTLGASCRAMSPRYREASRHQARCSGRSLLRRACFSEAKCNHHDAPAVLRGPCRGAQPAVGIDGELSLPAVQLLADPGWVECPTLDDLNEHGSALLSDFAIGVRSLLDPAIAAGAEGE